MNATDHSLPIAPERDGIHWSVLAGLAKLPISRKAEHSRNVAKKKATVQMTLNMSRTQLAKRKKTPRKILL